MTDAELYAKWLNSFGKGVDPRKIEAHVTSYSNLLWHLFSYEFVPCLKGDEARVAFDALEYDEAIMFYDGYSGELSDVCETKKITAKSLDQKLFRDIYVVAKDFSWTYVLTHERDMCGPYFCEKKIPVDYYK